MENLKDPTYFEILKMARELIVNEHMDKRAELHNKWLANAEKFWKTNRINLPYPTIPPYPTEKEIVARAQILLDFLSSEKTPNKKIISEVAVEPKIIEEPVIMEQKKIEVVVPIKETKIIQEVECTTATTATSVCDTSTTATSVCDTSTTATTISSIPIDIPKFDMAKQSEQYLEFAKIKSERELEEQTTVSGRILPSVLKRIESIRSNWKT